ncbi:APC family permease [Streptomyces sp. NPDC047108]|uniref:APC family permease n=1 Tax=Streptomyces sp. NPDC047108 TaxID=3155025 RepID=UPI0033DADE88
MAGGKDGVGRDRPESGALRRTLGVRDLVVYGLLFIAPMAPVGVFGALDARSHGAVALVYAVATVAMAFTAFSYALMVRVVPRAGSVFAYARAALGELPGFVAGWMVLLDYLLIPAVAYLFSGIAMEALVPQVDQWVWTAVAVVVTTALNLSGVRVAARAGLAVLVLEIAVLCVFVVSALVALAGGGAERGWLSPLTGDGSSAFSAGAVVAAVSVAVLSYLGFDAIASFAEEVRGDGPRRAGDGAHGVAAEGAERVGRAVLFCLALAGALFVLQTYLAALLTPVSSAALAAEPALQGAAFYAAVDAGVGDWLHDLIAVSKAIGAAFAALAGQAAAGRLLFAMARARRLPAALSAVEARSGVPRRALLLSAVVTLGAAGWASREDSGLGHLVSVVDVGALCAFTLLHASVIGWFAVRRRGPGFGVVRHLVVPLLGMAVTVAVIAKASGTALVAGAVWLAAGLLGYGFRRARRAVGGDG